MHHQRLVQSSGTVLKKLVHSICDEEVVHNTVTILGNVVPTSRTIALLLKQCHNVDEIRLYGKDKNVCNVALDLAQLDTNTKIKAYKGNNELLKESILGAKIIVICGGLPKSQNETLPEILNRNISAVRNIAMHCAEYNPRAIILVATPPINTFVPMISEEYKRADVYDPRKIIGVTTLSTIIANSIIGRYLKYNPIHVNCPVIGGDCFLTRIPILSQCVPSLDEIPEEDRLKLYKTITTAFRETLGEKYNNQMGPVYLSFAFSITRFISNLLNAMNGEEGIYECAYVRQTGHIDSFLPYMQSIVKLGPHGIEGCYMPKITPWECEKLLEAYPLIKRAIHVGTSIVNGEVMKKNRLNVTTSESCPLTEVVKQDHIGDVVIDLSKKYRNFEIYR